MRIAAIEYHPTSNKGGSEKAYFEVLSGLKKLGHDVTVFYTKEGNYLLQYNKLGIKYQLVPELTLNYFSLKSWYIFVKAAIIINKSKPDVIYINQLADSVISSFCKVMRNVKIVCHIRVPKVGNSRLFNIVGKLIDCFICVNQLIKRQYQPIFKDQDLIVINDGITIPQDYPTTKKSMLISSATYLGRISPEKGLIELLETWHILTERYDLHISLDITGPVSSAVEENYREKLIKAIEEKKLDGLVKIKNSVSDPFSHFEKYDFSVFPSIIDESFGRTMAESILSGTPVFARKVGIVEEVLSPAKDVFVYSQKEELANKIADFYYKKLIYDFEKLQTHIVENYDINNNVKIIETVLNNVHH